MPPVTITPHTRQRCCCFNGKGGDRAIVTGIVGGILVDMGKLLLFQRYQHITAQTMQLRMVSLTGSGRKKSRENSPGLI